MKVKYGTRLMEGKVRSQMYTFITRGEMKELLNKSIRPQQVAIV